MKILENQELLDTAPEVAAHSLTREVQEDGDESPELVSTSSSYYLALVCPAKVRKLSPEEVTILLEPTPHLLSTHLSNIRGEIIALDLETRGTNPLAQDAAIAGIGLTSDKGTLYIHTLSWASDDERWPILFDWLAEPGSEFVGHNVMFDGAWLYVWMGNQFLVNWKYDTYAIYRQLANEGYNIQLGGAYGLKQAQIDLLGWDSKGDEELEAWLIQAGYTTANGKKADKSKMFLAPAEVLGYYCGLDTYSTYHLLLSVFFPSSVGHEWAERFQEYTETFMVNLAALIEGYIAGIQIDQKQMAGYHLQVQQEAAQKKQDFISHPDIAPHLAAYRTERLAAYAAQEPNKFKAGPKLGQEPPRLTKKGDVSKNWENWEAKRQLIESGAALQVSQNWLDWKGRLDRMSQDELFNVDSTPMRQWLFYDALGFPILTTTEKGNPETGKKALAQWGEYGRMLKAYGDLNKETQMVGAALAASAQDGRIHPQFKAPGTFTGRLSGGSQSAAAGEAKFNIQQIPKKRGYLACWKPDPGFVFVDIDFTALEPMVMTALSRDKSLLNIYGPTAPKDQDIYLFVGSQLPGLGEKLRSLGYDPYRPTKESIDATKKAFKRERQIAKVIQLGSQYGMGPRKVAQTLTLDGIPTSDDEAYELWKSYWELFKGVKDYGYKLQREWKQRGGWVLNAIGRPITCAEDLLKDIGNRVVQSSGHDILMFFVEEVQKLRAEVDFEIRWAIVDFHDETIVQVPEDRAEDMCAVFQEAMRRLNERMTRLNPNFGLELKGVPAVERDFVGFKISD